MTIRNINVGAYFGSKASVDPDEFITDLRGIKIYFEDITVEVFVDMYEDKLRIHVNGQAVVEPKASNAFLLSSRRF